MVGNISILKLVYQWILLIITTNKIADSRWSRLLFRSEFFLNIWCYLLTLLKIRTEKVEMVGAYDTFLGIFQLFWSESLKNSKRIMKIILRSRCLLNEPARTYISVWLDDWNLE